MATPDFQVARLDDGDVRKTHTTAMTAGGIATLILCALGVLHVYWAAGGTAGTVIPTHGGRALVHPSPAGTALVAGVLFAMSTLLAVRSGWIEWGAAYQASRTGAWLLAGVFALRALGDFRHIGFFKRHHDSRFTRLDTLVYSPLCALLTLLIVLAALS